MKHPHNDIERKSGPGLFAGAAHYMQGLVGRITPRQAGNKADYSASEYSLTQEELLYIAEAHIEARQARNHFFPAHLFGEPVWDILLEMYVSEKKGYSVNVESASMATSVGQALALKAINTLNATGFIERVTDRFDRTKTNLKLTPKALDAMELWLENK